MRRKPVAQIHSNIVALSVNVSSRTVRRRLKEANITAHRPAIKHKLTHDQEANRVGQEV